MYLFSQSRTLENSEKQKIFLLYQRNFKDLQALIRMDV